MNTLFEKINLIVICIGLLQDALVVLYLFFSKRGNRDANIIFCFHTMAHMTTYIIYILFYYGNFGPVLPQLSRISEIASFTVPSLTLLYINVFLDKSFINRKRVILFFIPPILYSLYIIFFALSYESSSRYIIQAHLAQFTIEHHIVIWSIIIWYYGFISFFKYRKRALDNYSSTDKLRYTWLLYFLGSMTVLISTYAVSYIFNHSVNNIGLMIFTSCIHIIVPYILITNTMFHTEYLQKEVPTGKYRTSSLSSVQIQEYWERICRHMKSVKPYLEPELRLVDIANALAVPRQYISQTINCTAGKNFYDYVNGYRIEEAKKQLCSPAGLKKSILETAYNSGFTSKSTFNRLFKRETGLTPSEFARRNTINNDIN